MTNETIRVVIADDHKIVRKGLRALLATVPGIEVVGEAADGKRAVELARTVDPDVVLMDLVMPELDGIGAIQQLGTLGVAARVLVLTSYGSDNKLFPAIKAGAVGYLLKDASPEELIQAIRDAAHGRSPLDASVARRLLREFHGGDASQVASDPLTDRELEVLRELARGLSNDSIGERLCISEATVRTHVSNILAKLSLTNRTQAALYALRTGLASIDEIEPVPS